MHVVRRIGVRVSWNGHEQQDGVPRRQRATLSCLSGATTARRVRLLQSQHQMTAAAGRR
jgi:hypothetical protein